MLIKEINIQIYYKKENRIVKRTILDYVDSFLLEDKLIILT